MKIIDNIRRMMTLARIFKKEGRSIGFVPTMGYLHEGHLSLVKTAKKHTDVVVMSIFVNPLQFCQGEDLAEYPRDFKRDEELAMIAGVDVVFYPSQNDMYPAGYSTYVEVTGLTDGLCGRRRPGHFKGVTTVLAKLFGIVKPNIAYFGQKDAQQAIVIKKMVEDLSMDIEIKILPIVREDSGLAMSSRNAYLSEGQKRDADILHQSLKTAESLINQGQRDPKKVIAVMERMIREKPEAKIDYISIVDMKNLKEITDISGEVLVALAVYFGKTRLIDNAIVKTDPVQTDRCTPTRRTSVSGIDAVR